METAVMLIVLAAFVVIVLTGNYLILKSFEVRMHRKFDKLDTSFASIEP